MGEYNDYLSAVFDRFWDSAEHEFGDRPQLFKRSERSPNRSPNDARESAHRLLRSVISALSADRLRKAIAKARHE